MRRPMPQPENDNGTPEDRLAVVTVALRKAMEGLAAPIELLVGALTVEAPVAPTQPEGLLHTRPFELRLGR